MTYFGKVVLIDGSAGDGSWAGFQLIYTQDVEVDGVVRSVDRTSPIREDGGFAFDPGDPLSPGATVAVVSPLGELLDRKKLSTLLDGDSTTLKPFPVDRSKRDLVINPPDAPVDSSVRISGRVFVEARSVSDRSAAANLAVRILGASHDRAAMIPLFSGVTDHSGYFAGKVQRTSLVAAAAETGSSGSLVRHSIAVTSNAWLPEPVLLFITAGSSESADCGCHATPPSTPGATELAVHGETFSTDLGPGCPDFTIPNRTLEEFDFFKIVRTTDPTIKGLTLPDTVQKELNLPEVAAVAFDRRTLANTLGASALAVQTAPPPAAPELLVSSDLRRASAPSADGARTMARLAAVTANPEALSSAALADTGIADYLQVDQLEATGVRRGAQWGAAVEEKALEAAVRAAVAKIPPAALKAAIQDPDGFTPEALMTLERKISAQALAAYLNWRAKPFAGRGDLTAANPVDWDFTPEFYQATSIAHGHILHFKQEWRADGYSLGELVRSIPLAPGQKKQIATLDWDRADTATRTEATDSFESVSATLSRDRDIDEIASVAFSESLRGGSRATTAAGGGGFGLAIGPLVIGGGGGAAKASSTAWSDNSRNLSGQTLNQLRDRVSQGASSVRNQRSTVVQTVGQSERVTATTEVIANYNRCHALTIQYFEVLRHFAVHERLATVQECLFVPFEMTTFDDAKVLRWHDILLHSCRDRGVLPGFEAIRRLNSPEPLPPNRRYADDPIEQMQGSLRIRISIARPKDPTDAKVAVQDTEWRFFGFVLRVNPEVLYERYKRDQAQRDKIFRTEIAPEIAQAFLESLNVMLVDRDGREHNSGFSITVASRYSENGVMEIELNDTGAGPRLTRAQIAGVSIQTEFELPEFSKVVVESASVSYATERFSGSLFRETVNDDVLKGDPAFLSASQLSRGEERNQLAEMRRMRRRLLRHLNDNIEYYHRNIWLAMDANRRYMLLDGFEAPRSGGRSVASVVENRLIGVVGNCLVMPVAAGFQLDPLLAEALAAEEDPQKALERLYQVEPRPPRRLSVPTKGIFAEAIPGKCNSCEIIEEDRFWRRKDFPLPDSPSAISALSTGSRFAAGGSLAPTALPDALIKFQALPSLPDPTGMAAALSILGQDVFKDLTGLTNNQKNAMAALTTAMGSAEAFAGEAFQLAMAKDAGRNLDRTLDQIKSAKQSGLLTPEEASKATRNALLRSIAATPASNADVTSAPEVGEALKKASETPGGSATITRDKGEKTESVSFTVDEDALRVGAAAAHVVEYPVPIWVDVELVKDDVNTALDYVDTNRVANLQAARTEYGAPATLAGGSILLDRIGSAIASGLMRSTASGLQVRVNALIAYPADPANNHRILRPAGKSKYGFVAMVHGNSTAWEFGASATPTAAISGSTLPVFTVPLTERGDYRGYEYLQRHLAQLALPIVSISFSHGLPNLLDLKIETRSRMFLAALARVIQDASTPGSLLHDAVDFNSCGIMGHSRGGEAVVRAFLAQKAATTPVPGLTISAVCSLAPTDFMGASNNHKLVLPSQPGVNYLSFYGGLDGDVNGWRDQGLPDKGGNAFRLYDRAECDKAMVFIPAATHDRFNTIWAANEDVEWPVLRNGVALPGVPARALTKSTHLTLAREFIGGFFDLILNRNAAEQPRFRNETASATGASVSHQWRFATISEPVDNFSNPANPDLGNRALPATATLAPFAPLTPAVARDERIPHDDRACIVETTAAGTQTITYTFPAGAPNVFDAIRFRLGRLYPALKQSEVDTAVTAAPPTVDLAALQLLITNAQTAIDASSPPDLSVTIHGGGKTDTISQASILANQANRWARPEEKVIVEVVKTATGAVFAAAKDCTLMSLQTLQIRSSQLTSVDPAKISQIDISFTMPATPAEVWLDSIEIVLN